MTNITTTIGSESCPGACARATGIHAGDHAARRRAWASIAGTALLATTMLLAGAPARALEVAGVEVPETATVSGAALELNGAGIRKKFFVKVYVGALYLPRKMTSVEQILDAPGPNRVSMHFLYSKVSHEKLADGWNEGFEANQSEDTLATLKDRIDAFNALFPDVKKGDEITLDYSPDAGTSVGVNGKPAGTVPGADFNRAVLTIWLGKHPASKGLKKAMLGGQ